MRDLQDVLPQIPVLIIEDELEIRKLLSLSLRSHGYKTILAEDGRTGLQQAVAARPELVILDLGLPDMNGQDIVKSIREWSEVPIIILSALSQEKEKINALESGADDYLTKPFSMGELVARMGVALKHARRGKAGNEGVFRQGRLMVNQVKRLVTIHEEEVHLTPIEYQLLSLLVNHAGKVVTYSQLLREIWGKHSQENNNYLRIHMQHLRQKLKDDPLKPKYLMTEPGIGYRLRADN